MSITSVSISNLHSYFVGDLTFIKIKKLSTISYCYRDCYFLLCILNYIKKYRNIWVHIYIYVQYIGICVYNKYFVFVSLCKYLSFLVVYICRHILLKPFSLLHRYATFKYEMCALSNKIHFNFVINTSVLRTRTFTHTQ